MAEKQIEIELKLRIDPKHVSRLKQAPVLREVKEGRRLLTTHLVSIYHDTPKLSLARKGLALRVRKKGTNGWEQTVKASNGLREALPERHEWNVELPDGVLDLDKFTDEDVVGLLDKHVKKKKIERIFETDLKRSAVDLTYRDAIMELAIDQGVVRTAEKESPLSEVELELKEGHPAEISFRAVLAQGLRMILGNEICVRDDLHIEGCHQMRVGMRRLRVAFNLFKKNLPQGEAVLIRRLLKHCTKALDGLRDWDVFLTETLPMVEERFPDHPGVADLRKAAAKQREAALVTAREMLESFEYQQLLLLLGAWSSYSRWASGADATQMKAMSAPVTKLAEPLLSRAYKRVTKRGDDVGKLTVPQLHALRLDVKQMRYGSDFFGEVYAAKPVNKFRKELTGLQEILGWLNDVAVAESRLMALRPQLSKDGMIAIGLISGWFGARADHRLQGLDKAWKKFEKQKLFWK